MTDNDPVQQQPPGERASAEPEGSPGMKLGTIAINTAFFLLLVMSAACLCASVAYLFRSQDHASQIANDPLVLQADAGGVNKAISIAYESRIELLSTGVFVGLAFGFLGFGLIVIGIGGDISSEAGQGKFTVKLAHLSPGVFVIVCSTALVGISTTRSLPLKLGSKEIPVVPGTQASDSRNGNMDQLNEDARTRNPQPQNAPSPVRAWKRDDDPQWTAVNEAAEKGFAFLTKEAKEPSAQVRGALWTDRVAAFRDAELKLIDWENAQPADRPFDDLTKLELFFREGLYAEYAGDYSDAKGRFNQCRISPQIKNPKATWNGVPISQLADDHLARALSAGQTYQYVLEASGEIAQSADDSQTRNSKAYDRLRSAEISAHEWDGTSLSSVYLSHTVQKPTLGNDSKPPSRDGTH